MYKIPMESYSGQILCLHNNELNAPLLTKQLSYIFEIILQKSWIFGSIELYNDGFFDVPNYERSPLTIQVKGFSIIIDIQTKYIIFRFISFKRNQSIHI